MTQLLKNVLLLVKVQQLTKVEFANAVVLTNLMFICQQFPVRMTVVEDQLQMITEYVNVNHQKSGMLYLKHLPVLMHVVKILQLMLIISVLVIMDTQKRIMPVLKMMVEVEQKMMMMMVKKVLQSPLLDSP